MRVIVAAFLLLAACLSTTGAYAQTPGPTVQYGLGWNMVGGPPGTGFPAAAAFVTYGPTGYTPSAPVIATACQGAWAYFFHTVTQTLPSGLTSPQTCALNAGWTLVGDPFSTPASLPDGTAAFFWDQGSGQYVSVAAIAPGTSAWVYSPTAATINLTTPQTTYISGIIASGPYTVHVGDSVELLVPNLNPYDARVDPTYFQLQSAGLTGDLSCVTGQPDCQVSLIDEFWRWSALRAGVTNITLTPRCAEAVPACAQPSQSIQIDVLP